MKEIQAPKMWDSDDDTPRVFLGGSIEMGKAVNWQKKTVAALKNKDVTILNPRRDDWDSSWKQVPSFKPFKEQVEWEQLALTQSNHIIMNFIPDTQSPITLLELGICLNRWWDAELYVCCPKEYFRYGNVAITCEFHDQHLFENYDELLEEFVSKV